MNKEYHELVNRIKILNDEINELNEYISPIRYFLEERGKFFRKEDSIKALSIIEEDIEKMEFLLRDKRIEKEEIFVIINRNCNHSIVFNNVCPICGEEFYQTPETTSISIEIPAVSNNEIRQAIFTSTYNICNEYLKRIIDIFKASIKEENTLLYFEDDIEELQYDRNVKIRRLKI